MTNTRFASIIALVLCLAMAACGDKNQFKIKGEIEGSPNMNIYLKYYGNDAVRTSVTAATSGGFETQGSSAKPTLVEILDNEYNVLGWAWVANGENINLKLNRSNPYLSEASGNEVMERFSAFTRENADSLLSASPETVNGIIEGYISRNPADVVSSLLFITTYRCDIDPIRADSVMRLIDEGTREESLFGTYNLTNHRFAGAQTLEKVGEIHYRGRESDSVLVFNPADKMASLLVFTDENSHRADSVHPGLREIRERFPKRRLQMVEFVFYPDTMVFVRATSRDSADWVQAWTPGGVYARDLEKLALTELPYYIVADSAGRQIYRGKSATDATDALSGLIPD